MKTVIGFLLCAAAVVSAQTYKDPSARLEDRVNNLLKRMTVEEKVDLVSGTGFATKAIPRLGIPEIKMTDGPVGVRWGESVAFPASVMLAATFDTSLAYRYGRSIAIETKAKGRNAILGPCVNINRVPNGGRNFESYGEDPFLASRMAVSYVKGVQSEGVIATTKHFAVNNQETDRMTIDARVGERALQEIYFPAFKAAVQEGNTQAIMCAYNRLNGPYCSENSALLDAVLKKDWKFDGLVMSDWGAVHSSLGASSVGLDLEMPGGEFFVRDSLLPLVRNGALKISVLDDKVRRILRVMFRMGFFEGAPSDSPAANAPEQRRTALDVARSGIVLIKNEDGILPVRPSALRSVAVIGPNASVARTGGGGSSMVAPPSAESPIEALRKVLGEKVEVKYALGARMPGEVPPIGTVYFTPPRDTTGTHGLLGEYFDNVSLSGEPKLRRIDSTINFWWNDDAPAEGMGQDHFSVRWTGVLTAPLSGTYTITAASDDGIRVYIDGRLIIDHWSDHSVESRSAEVALNAGSSYDIKIEYYENGGGAAAMLGWTQPGENELAAAVAAARSSDLVLLFIGNSQYQESEGFDRPSIELDARQKELIDSVSAVNPNIVAVLYAGAPVTLDPWIGRVKGLLWVFFPGEEGSQAIADVVTGTVDPSGKLPFTVAKRWEDYPAAGNYPGSGGTVDYAEGILVGYRHFLTKNVEPRVPFGFGLSYSSFELTDLKAQKKKGGSVSLTVTVKNTGSTAGAEVVQAYVHDRKPSVLRPERELKAFAKVFLAPGKQKLVTLVLSPSAFEYYDDHRHAWKRSTGGSTVFVGTSSTDLPLSCTVE